MNEEKVIEKLLDHDARFDRIEEDMAKKEETRLIINSQDEILGILRRLDQERVFTNERIKRMEAEIEQHTQDIQQIKLQLQVV